MGESLGLVNSGLGAATSNLIVETFIDLVESLVDEFDVVELLTALTTRCVDLLGAAAAGILLVDPSGDLRVVASSTEEVEMLELFQAQDEQGPCLDCFHTGDTVEVSDLRSPSRWPLFAAESLAAGYPAVCAVPLRLREQTLGCLNMFMSRPVALPAAHIALARALADVATIAIVQEQVVRQATAREAQLSRSLESRKVIEQAKGMIAGHNHIDLDHAFSLLRSYARSSNQGITIVARLITTGHLSPRDVAPHRISAGQGDADLGPADARHPDGAQ